MGRVRSSKRRVRGWRFHASDYRSDRLSIGGLSLQGVSMLKYWASRFRGIGAVFGEHFKEGVRWRWLQIFGQLAVGCCRCLSPWAQYLGSHAGVGGWLCLLCALEMTFSYVMRINRWRFMLRGRRSIWWSWRVTLLAPRIGNDVSYVMRINDATCILRGRRSIWWSWRVTLLAPRIGNDVSYVRQIPDDLDIAWPAQYLVRLAGDFTFSAHWKWSFICHADHWWRSFCVAGAVFGDVGGWLYLLHALEMTFHMWRRSLMTFILRGRRSIWWSASRTFRGRRSTSWHFGR